MKVVHSQALWNLELAPGWHGEPNYRLQGSSATSGDELVGLISPTPEATCYVATFFTAEDSTGPLEWVEVAARFAQIRGAEVNSVRAGAFHGHSGRVVRDGVAWRFWWLTSAALNLNVIYACPPALAGRDDHDLDQMIASLKAGAPASN